MKFSRFVKLKRAITSLDMSFLAKKIAELEDCLTHEGQVLEPENTAVTEEGIFYINPESGMATKVVLYISDHVTKLPTIPKHELYDTGYTERKDIERLQPYHLLRCNTVSKAELDGWGLGYRIAQRQDDGFFYRFVRATKHEVTDEDIYQEIGNQRLFVCQNCFVKINSLLDGVSGLKRESFKPETFFNVDFFRSWCRHGAYSRGAGSLDNIYPKDWERISQIRKAQVQYHCEACNEDFSDEEDRKYLFVQPSDHYKKKISYVKLQCICAHCLGQQETDESSTKSTGREGQRFFS